MQKKLQSWDGEPSDIRRETQVRNTGAWSSQEMEVADQKETEAEKKERERGKKRSQQERPTKTYRQGEEEEEVR